MVANYISNMFNDASLRMQGRDPNEQAMKLKNMQALLESESGRQLLQKSQIAQNEARTKAMGEGRDYWGRQTDNKADPRIDQIIKLVGAADKTEETELANFLTAQAKLLTDEIGEEGKQKGKADKLGFSPEGADPIDVGIKMGGGRKSLPKASEYFTPEDDDFVGPPEPTRQFKGGQGGTFEGTGASGGWDESPSAYFQAPKTYEQSGITSVDDMAVIGEMQQALPDIDIKAEYEADPEGMKELIKLWKAKKVTKQNLHKAFSAIQQQAQESLGISK